MALTAPTVRQGQLTTNNVLADQFVIDMHKDVWQYDAKTAPAMRIIRDRSRSVPAKAVTVNWMEDQPVPYWTTLTSGINTSVTTIPVTSSAGYLPGHLVKVVSTGELLRVVSIISSTSISVTRAYGSVSATAASSGDYLLNLRGAEMQGDVAPDALSTVKVKGYNYCQIVKTPVHVTATNQEVAHYHGNELDYQRRKAGEAHARAWEEILLHGARKEDLSTGAAPIYAAGGLDQYISTNVLAAGGSLTEPEFLAWLGDGPMRYRAGGGAPGSGTKLLLAPTALINTINSWGLNKLQINQTATSTYGVNISTYVCGFGQLNVLYHPLLEQGYSGTAYVIDPDSIIWRPLRDTKLMTGIQAPDEDATKDLYLTEASFEFGLEAANGKITGITF